MPQPRQLNLLSIDREPILAAAFWTWTDTFWTFAPQFNTAALDLLFDGHSPRALYPVVVSVSHDDAYLNVFCSAALALASDGQALPPFMDDNAVWHVVRRADGRTHWRRISLNNPLVADWRTASGD